MRTKFKDNYILDSSGFIIDKEGFILDNYLDKAGEVYVNVEGESYYFKDLIEGYKAPLHRNIKYMKSTGKWKTFVISKDKAINNMSFDTEEEAALWVNILYTDNNLQRVPNAVPIEWITKSYEETNTILT